MEKTIFEVKQLNASYGQEVILKNLDFSIMFTWEYSSKGHDECE